MQLEITVYHLEMTDPGDLRPKQCHRPDFEIRRAEIPSPELNRFLYTAVGGDWYWYERLAWSYQEWMNYLDRPQLQTWVAYLQGTPVGYFEMEAQAEGSVEIVYFGLMPQFCGQQLGGAMLTTAVQRAWEIPGTRRVWLHTCTLDHQAALGNYLARGFRQFRTEVKQKDPAARSPGPWPGAR